MMRSIRTCQTGYSNPLYAESLSEFGQPELLSGCSGYLLKRNIVNSDYFDAMGLYPLFTCANWEQLYKDLDQLSGDGLVSVSLVPDPFGEFDPAQLAKIFNDVFITFKEHFIINLAQPLDKIVSAHHRYYARKSLRSAEIKRCDNPPSLLEKWNELYQVLVNRHKISGIPAFSRQSFKKQFKVPGLEMFYAMASDEIIGMQLWFFSGSRGYHHLSAYSEAGYHFRISYGLMGYALRYFQEREINWLDLGGGSGINNKDDGLAQFKKGWATGTKPVYFCGKILNHPAYDKLVKLNHAEKTNYFPAYRHGEFGGDVT